jgi:hypothetical protein
VSEHPIIAALRRESFEPLGWFAPTAADGAPQGCRFMVLIGNAGPLLFRRFGRERQVGETLDQWTERVVTPLAATLGAGAGFPFAAPPLPFLSWARAAGAGHVSPLGLNIHARFGLWHAFRAVLFFPVALDLPPPGAGAHPCEQCAGKPCLSACPVAAFSPAGYDVAACVDHIASAAGQLCMTGGCLARRACPVGRAFTYEPEQMQFHMRAFLKARQEAP